MGTVHMVVSVLSLLLVNSSYFYFQPLKSTLFTHLYILLKLLNTQYFSLIQRYNQLIWIEIKLFSTKFSKIHGEKIKCSYLHLRYNNIFLVDRI